MTPTCQSISGSNGTGVGFQIPQTWWARASPSDGLVNISRSLLGVS